MIFKFINWIRLCACLFCFGCFSPAGTSSYYTLNPVLPDAVPVVSGVGARLIIGIGPLTLPDYLDRPAVVTRLGPNRLEVNEGHRWAGTLHSEVLRTLASNLETMTGAALVVVTPWSPALEPDLRFRVDIQAFEGRRDGKVQLKAAWSLTPSRSGQPAVQRVTRLEEDTRGDDFDALAAAMGRALASLSRQMAEAVAKTEAVRE